MHQKVVHAGRGDRVGQTFEQGAAVAPGQLHFLPLVSPILNMLSRHGWFGHDNALLTVDAPPQFTTGVIVPNSQRAMAVTRASVPG